MTEENSHIHSGPSARKCIHGHQCRFNCASIMVKVSRHLPGHRKETVVAHGLNTYRPDISDSDTEDEGQDVVDCASYTLQKSLSASRALGKTKERKSLTPNRTSISDDGSGDGRQRSYSLPSSPADTSLSPLLNREYVRHTNIPEGARWRRSDKKHERLHVPQKATLRYSNGVNSWADLVFSMNMKILALILVPILVALLLFHHFSGNAQVATIYLRSDFQKDLKEIGTKYEINDDTMLQIQTGIETTLMRQDTSSLVFLYNDDNPINRDEASFKDFVNKVANVSAKFLRNNTETVTHIVVENSDLNVNTAGELLSKYREKLEEQGVLLVEDLEDIPVNLAMAFHYYCDEYDPYVKNTAIFFTLNLSKCKRIEGTSGHEVVEHCMAEKWSKLEREKLNALLNRVVSVVVDLDGGRY